MTKLKKSLVGVLSTVALGCIIAAPLVTIDNSTNAFADEATVVFNEDFSNGTGFFGSKAEVKDGVATITEGAYTSLGVPEANLLASNNYEFSFDLKANDADAGNVYIHFESLGGAGNNLVVQAMANGQYWRVFWTNSGVDVYNNSGDMHGGLDGNPVWLTDGVKVKIVHYEGYVELWLNGVRRAVSHLDNFGNNQYMYREKITENPITGFAIHADKSNVISVDNILIKEALASTAEYYTTIEGENVNYRAVMPVGAQTLNHENFRITATAKLVNDAPGNDAYTTITVGGINGLMLNEKGDNNEAKTYSFNIQANTNGTSIQPSLFARSDSTTGWETAHATDNVTWAEGDEVIWQIDVIGDAIQVSIDGTLLIDTTLTSLNITKGHLQYVILQAGYGGVAWKDFSYYGFDTENGIILNSDAQDVVLSGSNVTVNASKFGNVTESLTWYVNDEAQSETTSTLYLSNLTAGDYTVQYKGGNVASKVISFKVVNKVANVTASETEIYSNGSITATVELVGDFASENAKWYVDGEAQSETSTTLSLSNLAVGSHTIQYKGDETESNIVTITVKAPEIKVETEQKVYYSNQKATLQATVLGMEASDIVWKVNGETTQLTGSSIELDLSSYSNGSRILVQAVAGEVVSEEITLIVAYDLKAAVESTEYYQQIGKVEITDDATANYGSFKYGTDGTDSYLEPAVEGGAYFPYKGSLPSSTTYSFSYSLYVPQDFGGNMYIYPALLGFDGAWATTYCEIAWQLYDGGLRPYIKNQAKGNYEHEDYGLGVDFSFDGVAKKGDWNTLALYVKDGCAAMYLNDTLVLFVPISTLSIPSEFNMNIYPDGGAGVTNIKIKDYVVSSVVLPAPDLQSVTLSVAKVSANVNETINVTATLNPYNAEANEISWYVNDVKVAATGLTYAFNTSEAGVYNIKCVIDGVESGVKTITVTEASDGKGSSSGCGNSVSGIFAGITALGAVAAVMGFKKRKKD